MAALREQPRLVAAKLLVLVVVALAGGALAMALDDDPPTVPPETAPALERAQRSAQEVPAGCAPQAENRQASACSRRAATRLRRLERRLRAALARERRLKLALRRSRRALAQQN